MKRFGSWLIVVSVLLFDLPIALGGLPGEVGALVNGDVNCDRKIDLSDAAYVLNWLFLGGSDPCPLAPSPELQAQIVELQARLLEKNEELARALDEKAALERRLAEVEAQLAVAGENLRLCQAELAKKTPALSTCVSQLSTAQDELRRTQTMLAQIAVRGCTDPEADNWDCSANIDDGSCQFRGCTDPNAINYDQKANVDDGSCRFPEDAPGRLRLYTIAPLAPLSIHNLQSEALAVNNAGQIVGRAAADTLVPVMWAAEGTPKVIRDALGNPETVSVTEINDRGTLVGTHRGPTGTFPAISDVDGVMRDLSELPGQACAINDFGVVVGTSVRDAAHWNPDGSMSVLGTWPDSVDPTPLAINDRGEIVGVTRKGETEVPVIWDSDRRIRQLPVPFPFSRGNALDINELGIVAGLVGNAPPGTRMRIDRIRRISTDTTHAVAASSYRTTRHSFTLGSYFNAASQVVSNSS